MNSLKDRVYQELCMGASGKMNAVTIDTLARYHDVPRREIEKITEQIRDNGHPLCSNTKAPKKEGDPPLGLFIAQSVEEFMPYYRQIDHRIQKMSHRRKLMYTTLEKMSVAEGTPLMLEL